MSDRLLKESDVLRIAFQLPLMVNSAFADVVKALPSADRPQGKWITYYPPMSDMQKSMCGIKEKGYVPDKRFGRKKCSLCGCGRPMYEDNYCPNCGARMKGVDDADG